MTVLNVESISVDCLGGDDLAILHDSAGNDLFKATPTSATLSGPGFSSTVANCEVIHAYAKAGGDDTVKLYDSPGDDTFVGKGTFAKLYGDDFFVRTMFFEYVHAYAKNDGHDVARLRGSSEADKFVGTPTYGKLFDSNHFHRAKFFEEVHVYGQPSDGDAAYLTDSDQIDHLGAAENWAEVSGPDPAFRHLVSGFSYVQATGTTEGDTQDVAGPLTFTLVRSGTWEPIVDDSTNIAVTTDPGVQQMPSIAVNPLDSEHLVISYMDYSLVDTGYAGIGVSVSHDAGQTWQESSIPLPENFDEGAAQPIAKFDARGRVYVSFMAATFLGDKAHLTSPDWWARAPLLQSNNGVFVSRSDDGGLTWNQPVDVVSHLYQGEDVSFEIIPDLGIDTSAQLPNGQQNPNYGNLYVTWSRNYAVGFPGHPDSVGGIDIMVAVSGDGGQTWETQLQEMWNDGNEDGLRQDDEVYLATVIQDSENLPTSWPGAGIVDQPRLTVGPEGNVYVSHWGGGNFVVHLSTDGGESFASPDHTTGDRIAFGTGFSTGIDSTLPGNQFRMFVMREIVADPSRPGQVYAVDPIRVLDPLGNQVDSADIFFARSADSGQSWQTTFTVGANETSVLNDDNHGQIATGVPNDVIAGQVLARSAVDAQGNVAVIWYDTRRDAADHLLDVWATVSADGGQTFGPNFRLTDVSFDADQGVFTNTLGDDEYYLGDFIGLAMANGKAYASWTDTRHRNQDIFVRSFALDPPLDPPNDRFEPNDTAESTTTVGRVVQRVLPKLAAAPGDEDWFQVDAAATGELIASALFGEGAQPSAGGFRLELWDLAATTLLAAGDDLLDDSGTVIGREVRLPASTGDRLLVRVVGADAAPGAQTVDYSLRLQSLTADLGARAHVGVEETVQPGGGLLYLVEAVAAGSIDVQMTGGANVQGDLNLQVLDPGDFSVLATGQPEPFIVPSTEANDSITEANDTGLVQPGAVAIDSMIGDGAFGATSGDYDFFSFQAGTGQKISVDVNAFVVGSGLDSMILLYDSAGNALGVVDSAGAGSNETLSYVTDKADSYYVAVAAWESGEPGDPFTAGTGQGSDPRQHRRVPTHRPD